jgi:hypothetical protein
MDDRTVTTVSAGGADTRRTDLPHCTVVMCVSRWWAGAPPDEMAGEVRPVGSRSACRVTKKRRPRETLSDDGVLPPASQGQRGAYFPHCRTVKPNAARSSSRRAIEWPRMHHRDRTALPSCARASRIWTGQPSRKRTVWDIGRAQGRRPSGAGVRSIRCPRTARAPP